MTTSPVLSITDEMLDELQQKAKAATPGPWSILETADNDLLVDGPCDETICSGIDHIHDAEHIAAANPETILALVEHIRSLTERLEKASWISVSDRLPSVAEGDEQEVIVCVRRGYNGKAYSFAARYLNNYPLYSEDADADEAGILLATGWYEAETHVEFHTWFSPLIDVESGDEVSHWMPIPAVPAIAQEGADHE